MTRAIARIETDPRAWAVVWVAVTLAIYLRPMPPSVRLFGPVFGICLLRWPGRGLAVVALLAAAWTAHDIAARLADRWPVARNGDTVELAGRITGLIATDPFRERFVLARDEAPRRVRLSWYEAPQTLMPGDCVRARVKLDTPHGAANPGVFDYEAWLWREGIDATGYIRESLDCDRPARYTLDRWRAQARNRLETVLEGSPMTGVVAALTLGARDGITDAQWAVLRATGTSHLVAISGLHIGLIAALVFVLARAIGLRLRARWQAIYWAGASAFVAAFAYALLAGFALPTQRALVMVTAGLVAVCAMRAIAPSRVLAFAALAVVVLSPVSVITPGFWLSFGAVAWLMFSARALGRSRVLGFLKLQFALVLGLTPLSLWFFGQASLIAPLVNAVLIPLAGLFIPVLLAATLAVALVPVIGVPLLQVSAWLMTAGWSALAWLAAQPVAMMSLPIPGGIAFMLAVVAIVLVLMPRGLPGRALAPVLLLPALIGWQPRSAAIAHGAFRLTMLDVGQGLALVIRTQRHTLVYDTGPAFRTGFNAGEAFVVPYLAHLRIGHIDRLVVSHGDIDHAGGVDAIRDALTIGRSIGADMPTACRAGMSWRWDGVDFSVVYPWADDSRRGMTRNAMSCVLRIDGAGGSALLTGDIEAATERRLVARDASALTADLLVVAHHGSASSTTDRFLDAVSPRHALISAGFGNRWDFPRPDVLERLMRRDIAVWRTDRDGAVEVHVPAGDPAFRPVSWRRRQPRVWHTP